MDALKILGSLLGSNAMSSGIGGQIFGQLINSLGQSGTQPGGNSGGGLGGVLGSLLGGGTQQPANQTGGLGGLLGGLLGGGAQTGGLGGLGGLGGILGQLAGGGRPQQQGGGIPWAMLGGLAMTAFHLLGKRGTAAGAISLADLSQTLAPGGEIPATVMAKMNEQALTLIEAMINAAKADGQIDEQEQQNIVAKLADLGPQEAAFVEKEIAKPLNLDFLSQVTHDMAANVYMVSLMAINLDSDAEVQYMQKLAQALGLDPQTVNGLHQQLGVTPLYS